MHIVGGFYRELCCKPAWDAEFGSGGRAAAAISSLSPGSTLYTYTENFDSNGVAALKELGVHVQIKPRSSAVVFSYFHPLSRPHIQPQPEDIDRQPQITVHGDAVLRFGFLEGDAVVDARRAVYDPQTWRNPMPFGENGSTAKELAIVLNELELRSVTGKADIQVAATSLIETQRANIVVVKEGVKGASVIEQNGKVTSIPAYRSSRVFKIGTGDVFSAIFAKCWAEDGATPADAADIASRSVAAYCSTGRLPLSHDDHSDQAPIKYIEHGVVQLEGSIETLGQRYAMEEARFVLHEMGVSVVSPALDDIDSDLIAAAVLIIADGLDSGVTRSILDSIVGIPAIVLLESERQLIDIAGENITVTDDFSSAIYFAAWASAETAR